MDMTAAVGAFWPHHRPTAAPMTLRDNTALADGLGVFILAGVKTATAGLLWEFENCKLPIPALGDQTVILAGDEQPLCIIQTTATAIVPYSRVDQLFARLEGEGFASVADWRAGHWPFIMRRCAAIGRAPTLELPVICHRCRLVYPATMPTVGP